MPDLSDVQERAADPRQAPEDRVGWRFIALYALAFMSTSLVLIAPLLVTLALKVDSLVGIKRAPDNLALVTASGALVAMVGNPFFGRMSDRTSSRWGMRRPWMLVGLVGGSVGVLIVAFAPSIAVTAIGWCVAQLFFNALLAAQIAVLPDQVPVAQRGMVSGILGVCLPVASVCAAVLVALFTGHRLLMFLAPCAVGGLFIVAFAVMLDDRRLDQADKPTWSMRELLTTFYVNPRKNPDFAWAFTGRFLFVLAYAFLITYQTYYLLRHLGSHKSDVPHQILLGVLAQSVVLIVASLISGRISDRTGLRKIFVVTASIVYGLAMFVVALASDLNGYLVGMAIGGLGFGMYIAVDLALVADVLPDPDNAAKDLGVFNIAGALPFSVAPAITPVILAVSGGSYSALYAVAGACAIVGAAAILPVRASAEVRRVPTGFGRHRRWRPPRTGGWVVEVETRAGEVVVHYVEHGAGRPVLVLHGAGVDHREPEACFEPVFRDVAGFRRIYPDLPGMGRTVAPAELRSAEDVLDSLLDFAAQVTDGAPHLLIGHSAGAYYAQAMAARVPEQVAGLALVCPLLPGARDVPEHRVAVGSGDLGDDVFRGYFVVQTQEMLERYDRYVAPAAAIADQAALERIGERWELPPERGAAYQGPTLVLAGRLDSTVGYAAAADLLDVYPHASLAVVDDAGHALPHEQPELLRALVAEWLVRVERSG